MDISYYEDNYIEFHYYNYTAQAEFQATAFNIELALARVIHLMKSLTYRIKEESRIHKISPETRLRSIASETRQYQIKEG